jgi:hypothetical protein
MCGGCFQIDFEFCSMAEFIHLFWKVGFFWVCKTSVFSTYHLGHHVMWQKWYFSWLPYNLDILCFSYLIALGKTSSAMLSRKNESRNFCLFLILDFSHLNMMPVLNFSFMAFIYVQVMVYFINWFSYTKLPIHPRVNHAWSWSIFLLMCCWILFASTFFGFCINIY